MIATVIKLPRHFAHNAGTAGSCAPIFLDKTVRTVSFICVLNAHHRKKQPVLVRQQLLEVAARLAASDGMAAVTLDAVSAASSVSKGGLLHHFPTKNALLDALFESLLEKFDADIEELMRGDPLPQGRFTRAYLRAVSGLKERPDNSRSWTQVTIALLAEPRLRLRWRQWVQARAEDIWAPFALDAQVVRFAADGLWFSRYVGKP